MKYVWQFHNWYDRQKEPKRFLIMLLLVFPVITLNIWVTSPALFLVWVAYLLLMLGPRVWRHHVRLKKDVTKKPATKNAERPEGVTLH